MKTLVVVAAGAADRPLEDLGGRTPLEAAATPALDRLAKDGRLGRLVVAPEGTRPEEGAFALALFGLDPRDHGEGGGLLDATAFDAPVGSLDQAFRLALVTADRQTVFDATAGRIGRDEAALLLAALSEAITDADLVFHAGSGWRNVLVWKGARDVRVRTVPPFEVVGKPLRPALPKGTGTTRLLAAIERSLEVLSQHEVNELRRDLGENPATLIWPWAPGVSSVLPAFSSRSDVRAAVVATDPAVVGAARLQQIPVTVPESADAGNLRSLLDAALSLLDAHDLVWLHLDFLAEASHARDFVAKVEGLEHLDGYVVAPALEDLDRRPGRLVVIGGEAVSVETARHLGDPVPFALHGPGVRSHRRSAFTEVAARDGGLLVERPHELLDFLLHLPE